MRIHLTYDVEEDGRIIAGVPELPGVLVYGADKAEARRNAVVLALKVVADFLEHGDPVAESLLPEVIELPSDDSGD